MRCYFKAGFIKQFTISQISQTFANNILQNVTLAKRQKYHCQNMRFDKSKNCHLSIYHFANTKNDILQIAYFANTRSKVVLKNAIDIFQNFCLEKRKK